MLRDDRGISALEFAIVVPLLVLLAGGVTDLGLMLRDRGALSVALNAGTRAALLLGSSATTAATVAVSTGAACPSNTSPTGSITASYEIGTITSAFWANGLLPPPLSGITLSATACYPVPAS